MKHFSLVQQGHTLACTQDGPVEGQDWPVTQACLDTWIRAKSPKEADQASGGSKGERVKSVGRKKNCENHGEKQRKVSTKNDGTNDNSRTTSLPTGCPEGRLDLTVCPLVTLSGGIRVRVYAAAC